MHYHAYEDLFVDTTPMTMAMATAATMAINVDDDDGGGENCVYSWQCGQVI